MKRFILAIPVFLAPIVCHAGVIEDAGIAGGIVVHLNCGDGEATAELAADNQCLIHGLDAEADNISKARALLRSKGLYGRVSVARFEGKRLPYADNTINLMVADGMGNVPVAEGILFVNVGDRFNAAAYNGQLVEGSLPFRPMTVNSLVNTNSHRPLFGTVSPSPRGIGISP